MGVKFQLVPVGARVLVALEPIVEQKTAGGLILPGQAVEDKWRRGTVRAVGPKVKEDLTPGQTVLLSGFAGSTVPGDDDARLVNEDEIWGVIEDER